MVTPLDKMPRVIDLGFIAWIKSLTCIICQAPKPHPHHVIGHGFGGGAMKADDYLVIPLCGKHHTGDDGVHRGHESWESRHGCQLKMSVVILIKAFVEQVIPNKTCMKYLLKLEPWVGMSFIQSELSKHENRGNLCN